MGSLDLPLLAIWSVAVVSLALQVYLFVTWPSAHRDPQAGRPQGTGGAQPSYDAATQHALGHASMAVWDVPAEAVLDGIFPAAPLAGGARLRTTRSQRPQPTTLQQRLVRAGIYRKGGMRAFHVARVAGTAMTFAVACFGSMNVPLPFTYALCVGATAALAAYLAPSFWLDQQLRVRQVAMRRALPDALDLITVCIQGGLSLPAALDRVARELGPAHPMLATELSMVGREIQMGRTTGNAMLQFAQRFNLEELRSLAAVIGQTEKYGGSIASALKTYAEGLRTKRRQRAEEMAQKAAVKLLFPTLICIFPGIFVVVLGPTAVRMYEVMSGVSWGG